MSEIKKEWLVNGIEQETITWAQGFSRQLTEGHDNLTTSQLRKFFGEFKRIQAMGYDKAKTDFILLQAKLAYSVGRATSKGNALKMKLFADTVSKGIQLVSNEDEYNNFIDVLEAIVAYHKYYEKTSNLR